MLYPKTIRSSVGKRLIVYIVLFSSLITLIITLIQLYHDYNIDIDNIHSELEQIENVHLNSLTSALWASNTKLLQTSIDGILKIQDMQYIEIRDEKKVWAKAGKIRGRNIIEKSYPMAYHHRHKDINIGTLTIDISLDGVYQRLLDKVWVILISNGIKTTIVALFIYFLFYRMVTRHLSAISRFSEEHDPLSDYTPLSLDRKDNREDEFDVVVKSINEMHARLAEQLSEIHQQKQYLSQTLNSIGDAVVTTDEHGNVTRLNPVAEQLTGWTNDEAQNLPLKTIFPIINATTRQAIANPVDKVLATGETVYLSNHTTLISKDGTEYQIADSAAPILNNENAILGMVLVFNDVTGQYQMREALYESEQQLRQLSENINEVFWLGSPDWNEVFYISPAYEKLWGFSAEELYAQPRIWIESVHPDDKQQVLEDIPKTPAEIHSCVIFREYRMQKPDGEILWIKARAYPVYNNDGEIIRIAGVAEDITGRKHNEDALHLSNEKFTTIFQTSPAGILITDINTGMILDANNTAQKILGYLQEEAINTTTVELNIWKNIDDRNRVMLQLKEKKYIHEPNLEMNHKSGKTITLSIDFALIKINKEDVVISSFIDITKRIRQEEQLRRSQKMDALGKLTGGIAHDYNNMLGVILGYSELLRDMLNDQPKLQAYVDKIAHAGDRGAKLTKKLLAFSRNKSSDVARLNINNLLRDEQHMLEKTLTARIQLELKLENELWPVLLDESELEDVVLNMSINSMHAIEKNGRMTIETSNKTINTSEAEGLGLNTGDYVLLTITDTGCGMDEATRDKIFDPFYSTKGEKGTGLGLSQVYGFITRSSGAITIDSKPGQGARFTLYLPRYHGKDSQREADETKTTTALTGKETILVVDDEPALLELTCEILEQQEYRVIVTESAKQALKILEIENIDLLLSDIVMPEMDGYALAAIVHEKYPGIKIQLASGFPGDYQMNPDNNLLSHNVLEKPYNSQTLLKKIRELLR
jgi:PAS domain S-box-containing protein